MELRGHILPPGTHSPAGPPPGRLQELRERQRGLRHALGLRLRELRRLCLQEAELTGKLPPEYPLEPGERPQPPPRRRSAAPPRGPLTEAARAARREVAVQLQVVEAARRLASAPGLPPEQRRRRQRLQAEAAQRLRQLRAQLDENGSLCELPGLENGFPTPKPPLSGAGRPSPPRAPSGSPDRRPLWASDPSTGGPSRRNSLASPTSPARTLPRSASSFEGRSVPATPVLARSPHGPPLCRPESSGLPPRPWSGSQDSQLGGPPTGVTSPPQAPPPTSSALPPPPRTRRSNSSEALIDWGGATPEPPPEAARGRCAPPSAEQRRSQKWLALEGLRDWYLRHTGGPQNAPPPPPQPRPQPPAWPPPRRRDPPGLPHSLSYAGALTPRDPPVADPDPQPPGTLV